MQVSFAVKNSANGWCRNTYAGLFCGKNMSECLVRSTCAVSDHGAQILMREQPKFLR